MVRFVDKIMRVVEVIMIALLTAAVLVIVAQIFWRYVLRAPLGWTEQVARTGFIWLVMLGIPAMFNRNIKMSFDIILNKIPGRANTVIQFALLLVGLSFCVFYFTAGLQLCMRTGGRMVPGMPIPLNLLYSAQPAGSALLFIVFLKQTVLLFHETATEVRSI